MILDFVRRYGTALAVYLLIGGASALAEWSVFWGLIRIWPLHYAVAAALGFVVGTFVNYVLCVTTVFVSKTHSRWRDLAMVYVASVLAFAVNLSTLVVLIREFGFDPMLSKIAGTGAAFFVNFATRQFIIFGQGSRSLLTQPLSALPAAKSQRS